MVDDSSFSELVRPYHKKQKLCHNRPSYRQSNWERAVKVYTINQESKYLLVKGVQSVGVTKELMQQFQNYGEIEQYKLLVDYPSEEFTEVYWINFKRLQSARFAKKKLDNRSFYGGQLHVCYAPEYETVNDTREKINERKDLVLRKLKEYAKVEAKDVCNRACQKERPKYDFILYKELNDKHEQKNRNIYNQSFGNYNIDNKLVKEALPPQNMTSNVPRKQHNNFSSVFPEERLQMKTFPHEGLSEFPPVPTHHATLPIEIQKAKTNEIYPNQDSDAFKNKDLEVSFTDITQHKKCTEPAVKKKRVVWNTVSNSTRDIGYQYTKEPGAWDPFKEIREYNHSEATIKTQPVPKAELPKEDHHQKSVADGIRNRLMKTAEQSRKIEYKEAICPLQKLNTQQSNSNTTIENVKRKQPDGRKRI